LVGVADPLELIVTFTRSVASSSAMESVMFVPGIRFTPRRVPINVPLLNTLTLAVASKLPVRASTLPEAWLEACVPGAGLPAPQLDPFQRTAWPVVAPFC
jgi:hypothetical protein